MPNTSATGGYLLPEVNPAPLEDSALEDFLHDVIANVSGMANDKVRPSYQSYPPNTLVANTDWMAFWIQGQDSDTYAVTVHDPAVLGSDELQRHETVDILVSSYGPNASKNLGILRDGLQIPQNREVLNSVGMGLTATGRIIPVPSLVKEKWRRRCDMAMIIRRQIRRTYPVLSLVSANGTLNTIVIATPINVVP
jgi:hypothetical protein